MAQSPADQAETTQQWTADDVAVARLCVSERSFAPVQDCSVIAGIVARHARRHGLSIAQYVATRHIHHTDPRSTRAWIGRLSAKVDAAPEGWPEQDIPWEARGRELWLATLAEAHAALTSRPGRCGGQWPTTWGGRVDAGRIARMTVPAGGYVIVNCGHTANTFLARIPPRSPHVNVQVAGGAASERRSPGHAQRNPRREASSASLRLRSARAGAS